jgi:choline dehydrogenase-like flavoprotein
MQQLADDLAAAGYHPFHAPCGIVHCKAHELDNLYEVDTSFFVSIGAVNPSLTALANAIRVGDHLLERLR